MYKSKTEKQKKIESDLDAEISRMSATIDKYRAEIGGTMALKENAAAVKQQIDIMQRRLVHAQRRNLDAKGEQEATKARYIVPIVVILVKTNSI